MFVLLYLQTRILLERWVGTSSDTGSQCFYRVTSTASLAWDSSPLENFCKICILNSFSNLNYFKLESNFQAFIFKLHDSAMMQMHLCL